MTSTKRQIPTLARSLADALSVAAKTAMVLLYRRRLRVPSCMMNTDKDISTIYALFALATRVKLMESSGRIYVKISSDNVYKFTLFLFNF